jgi:hypothetical protein
MLARILLNVVDIAVGGMQILPAVIFVVFLERAVSFFDHFNWNLTTASPS